MGVDEEGEEVEVRHKCIEDSQHQSMQYNLSMKNETE